MNTRNAVAFTALVAISLVVGFCHPANAHTRQERAAWYADWENRAMNTGYPEELLAELADFTARHTTKPSTGPAGSPPLPGPVEPHAYTAGVEQWRSLVATYFPAEQVDRALRIMSCESAGDPNAYNRSGASGLFQHMARYWAERSAAAGWAGADIFDPTANVAVAAWLSKGGSDWSDWACSP